MVHPIRHKIRTTYMTGKAKRFCKKYGRRQFRKWGKKLLDDAPKKYPYVTDMYW